MKIFQPQYVIPTLAIIGFVIFCILNPAAGLGMLIALTIAPCMMYCVAACITKSWAPWRHL